MKNDADYQRQIFTKNLNYYIRQSGKQQKEIAKAVGVSTSTFNNWCVAKSFPRIDKVELLANYFNIKKSDLIEDKVTTEQSDMNTFIASATIRMRTDEDFRQAVELLHKMDRDKVAGVKTMLEALTK